MTYEMETIATIYNNYTDKFGIPRQSNLLNNEISTIVFDKKYRDDNSLRGLNEYSHVWLLWLFSENNSKKEWSPTVRPPRLGGNKRMGVFATRSPYHPNGIGLSCVKIEEIVKTENDGTVLKVSGADLMSGTPIVDIKPYLCFADCIPNAVCGFSEKTQNYCLDVKFNEEADVSKIPKDLLCNIQSILSQDPTPHYIDDIERVFGLSYGTYNVKFKKNNNTVYVIEIKEKAGEA